MAAIALYSFLAEHIDPTCGAVVAEQQFLADKLNVSRSTIKRWLNYLETKNAVVRIPVAGNVRAYALDPMRFEGLQLQQRLCSIRKQNVG